MSEERIDEIALRWTLRDIRANRLKLSPLDPRHLDELQRRDWVEMHDGKVVITESGYEALG